MNHTHGIKHYPNKHEYMIYILSLYTNHLYIHTLRDRQQSVQ